MNNIEPYIENIFNNQTEELIENLLYKFSCENGGNSHLIDEAIFLAIEYSTKDIWGGVRYNRKGIKLMLEYISN